jgi:hypothetical protein
MKHVVAHKQVELAQAALAFVREGVRLMLADITCYFGRWTKGTEGRLVM